MKAHSLITSVLLSLATELVQATESIGPTTVVPPTGYSVSGPTPACDGTVTSDDVLTKYSKAPVGTVADWADQNGYGDQKHQNYAECKAVCASIPVGVSISEANIHIYWDEAGSTIDLNGRPYDQGNYGRFNAGAGYHEIDPDFSIRTVNNAQIVCKIARNWASHSRLFQMKIIY